MLRHAVDKLTGKCIFSFVRKLLFSRVTSFSRVTVPFCIPVSSVWLNYIVYILSLFVVVTFFLSHSNKWYLTVFWICISLMVDKVGHLFICFSTVWIFSYVKSFFMTFARGSNWTIYFFTIVLRTQYIFQILVLCWICVLQIFPLTLKLVFPSL